jgi:hypothetical protein
MVASIKEDGTTSITCSEVPAGLVANQAAPADLI